MKDEEKKTIELTEEQTEKVSGGKITSNKAVLNNTLTTQESENATKSEKKLSQPPTKRNKFF